MLRILLWQMVRSEEHSLLPEDRTIVSTSIHVEQRPLAPPPNVPSGTTVILYPLRNATLEDLHLRPILDNHAKCDVDKEETNVLGEFRILELQSQAQNMSTFREELFGSNKQILIAASSYALHT